MAVMEHRYAPRGAAVDLFRCRAKEVLLAGPAGTGKSRAALEKLLGVALKYSGMKGLIVRQVAATLGATALETWRNFVIPELLLNGTVRFYGGSKERAAEYQFANGSRILIGGMDDPIKIMSSEYDIIYVQEATELRPDGWEKLTTRLRNGVLPYQQLIADCNPDAPTHWLKHRCDIGQTVMLYSRHEDNPLYFDSRGNVTPRGQEYLATLDALTGVRKERLRYGRWVAAEGVIYEDWNPVVHVLDRFPIPPEWPRWWTVDFGYTNPFVCQWWAQDPDGRLYLYRELYHTGRTVDVHARQIRELSRDDPAPQGIICDHDAENRAVLDRELQRSTVPAEKTVKPGIEAVQVRLKPAGDGRPRLFLLRDSLVERDPKLDGDRKPCSTFEEMPGYIWAPPVNGRAPKEEPVKENDHGMDAMRYMVAQLDLSGRPRYRAFDSRGTWRSR